VTQEAQPPQLYGVSVPVDEVQRHVLVVRGQNVMLDDDVAALYGVARPVALLAVQRNLERFPEDFVFQLNQQEVEALRSQKLVQPGRRSRPHVFTEQGVAMLSSVLSSPRAVQLNIELMRTFIHLRETLAGSQDLTQQLRTLEQRYETQFKQVFDALNKLTPPFPEEEKPRLGFPLPQSEDSSGDSEG
jgi:hypothetical protein